MKDYKLSLTSVSMMPYEMYITAKTYIECNMDWECTFKNVIDSNLMQKNRISTQKRELREFRDRISNLNNQEIVLLAQGLFKKELSFLACIKTYRILREFIKEVLYNKKMMFDYTVLESDWNNFFELKKSNSKQLSNIAESTQKKVRRVIFKILKDIGLIKIVNNQKIIEDIYLDTEFVRVVCRDDPNILLFFLIKSSDIKHYCR